MEKKLLKKQEFTAEYRFAEDLVKAAVKMRLLRRPSFAKIEIGETFVTNKQRKKIKTFFTQEGDRLDEYVRKYTIKGGLSDYSDERFLSCVVDFIKEYKSEHESEEEFLLACSKIAYVAAHFLKENDQSDAINVAVDRVYEMIIDTFYPSMLIEGRPLIKDVSDRKYRFSYDLIRTLVKLRGVSVPKLELPNLDNCTFPQKHKQTIRDIFINEWVILEKKVKSFVLRKDGFDYSDENLSRCLDKIIKDYESEQNTDGLLLVSARVGYAAALFLQGNCSNAMDLSVDRIHQMVKSVTHCKKYEQDDAYRFSCDLVAEIAGMRSNPLSIAEMSDSGNSFFMVAHRNKIEELLSKEKTKLDEVVRKFISKDESSGDSDNQFLLCIDEITDDYRPEYTSTEEMVLACTRIAYVAACFSRKRRKSNAPGLAVDRMLEIVKDINCFTNSKEVFIMHTQDAHYCFAYVLVKTVLEMKNINVSDIDLPDPCNLLLENIHRKKIEKLFMKKKSRLDKLMKTLNDKFEVLDYSDGNFIQCMFQIIKHHQSNQMTEKLFVYVCVRIACMSTCFLKKNINSNAAFLAVNRIYEMIKDVNRYSNSPERQVLIIKAQDEHYRFAYDVVKTVLEIKEIPLSYLDLPDSDNHLFSDTHRNKIQMLLEKERLQLDEMMEKFTGSPGHFNCSDDKFLLCMDQIVQDNRSNQNTEEGFLYVCARIAYIAAGFIENKFDSKATFLAVNRIYEMSKYAYHFSERMEESGVKDDYNFAYDLVKAAFEIRSKPTFHEETSHIDVSSFKIPQRNEIQHFLSKEWPSLHGLVRRFTRRHGTLEFSDDQFLECMHQIVNDYAPEQKSEGGLIFVFSRIAYVATCFLRKNQNSNATNLAIDRIYQMIKTNYYNLNMQLTRNVIYPQQTDIRYSFEEKSLIQDKYRLFAHDLVGTVMELQNTPYRSVEINKNSLFTSQHRKKIKKLFMKQSTEIEQKVEKITTRDGTLDCSDRNFLFCMDEIFKDYEGKKTTKDGFVCLCARIVYPVSYFVRENDKSNAKTLAVERIDHMVRNTIFFNKDLEEIAQGKSQL